MRCPYCGANLRDTAKFCNRCGQKIIQQEVIASENEQQFGMEYSPAPSQDMPVRRGVSKKLVIGGVFACVAIVVAIVLIVVLSAKSNDNYLQKQNQLSVFSNTAFEDDNFQIIDKEGNIVRQDNASALRVLASLDDKTCLVYDEDAAYYYRNGKISPVDVVSSGLVTMSADGSTVLSVLSDSQSDYLYMYPESENKLIEFKKINRCIVSPSGEFVCANIVDDSGDTVNYLINTKTNSKTRIEFNGSPMYISDTGKTIYFNDIGTELFSVWKDGEIVPLVDGSEEVSLRQYNIDNTQLVYDYEGKTYLYDEKIGKTTISNMEAMVLRPPCTQIFSFSVEAYDYNIGVRDFRDVYLFSSQNKKLQYLDDNLKAYDVATNVESPILSSDGKRVVYQSTSNEIYRVDGSSESGRNAAMLSPEYIGTAETMCVSSSGNKIYLLKSNGDLYCNNQLIDTNVDTEKFRSGQIFDGEKLIYIKAGQAYVSEGSTPYKITGLESEYVSEVYGECYYPMICIEHSVKNGGKSSGYYYIQSRLIERY